MGLILVRIMLYAQVTVRLLCRVVKLLLYVSLYSGYQLVLTEFAKKDVFDSLSWQLVHGLLFMTIS